MLDYMRQGRLSFGPHGTFGFGCVRLGRQKPGQLLDGSRQVMQAVMGIAGRQDRAGVPGQFLRRSQFEAGAS